MLIKGMWYVCDDGTTRPAVLTRVLGDDGKSCDEYFLLDTGADSTVLAAALLAKVQLARRPAPPGLTLVGVSGTSSFVVVNTVLEFARDDGGTARVRGNFMAFTDPAAADLSILGRDVLDHFDVIFSRRRNEVLLLAPNHQYHVTGP